MKKILFLDSWTKSIRNFARLIELLEQENCTYKLLHLQSWSENSQDYMRIMDIDCFDIRSYKTDYIYNVLKEEKPDVVLILNLSYLLDRVVVSMCNRLKIKVYFLAHGRIQMNGGVGDFSKDTSFISRALNKLYSKPRKVLKNYIRFNLITRFRPSLIMKTLLEFYLHPDKTLYTPYTEEFKVSKGMVYYEAEKKIFEEQRHFPKGMIEVIGNPELDGIIRAELIDKEKFLETLDFKRSNYVLYLDDGFLQNGIMSIKEWQQFIKEIYSPINNKGWGLIIKLHPRTDITECNFLKMQDGIFVIKDIDFKNVIQHSEYIISHNSSTVIYGMIQGKPIILPRWGMMTELSRNYPHNIVYYCNSIEDYETIVNGEILAKNYIDYLRENCGTLDGKACERVVKTILEK